VNTIERIKTVSKSELPYIEKKNDTFMWAALYLLLEREPCRDTIFFRRIRWLSPMLLCDRSANICCMNQAKMLVAMCCDNEFHRYGDFRKLDVFLGTMFGLLTGNDYFEDDIKDADNTLTRLIGDAVDEVCLSDETVFRNPKTVAAYITIYMIIRRLNDKDTALWTMYEHFNAKSKTELHLDLIYKVSVFVERIFRSGYAEMYGSAYVLWIIMRVLRCKHYYPGIDEDECKFERQEDADDMFSEILDFTSNDPEEDDDAFYDVFGLNEEEEI